MRVWDWIVAGTLTLALATGAVAQERPVPASLKPTPAAALSGSGLGQPEALALTAEQFDRGARAIINQLTSPTDRPLLVAAGATRPDTSAYELFELRRAALEVELTRDAATATSMPASGDRAARRAASPLLGQIRAPAVPGSFKTQALDEAAFLAALLAHGDGRIQPLDAAPGLAAGLAEVGGKLEALEAARQALEPARRACVETRAAHDLALAGAGPVDRLAIRLKAVRGLDACARLQDRLDAHTAFVADYGRAGGGPLVEIIRQAALARQLRDADLLLVDVHATAQSSHAQINLLSRFGGKPFHATAALVVSWRRLAPDGRVVAAGWRPLYDGFRRMQDVSAYLDSCAPAGRAWDADCRESWRPAAWGFAVVGHRAR